MTEKDGLRAARIIDTALAAKVIQGLTGGILPKRRPVGDT